MKLFLKFFGEFCFIHLLLLGGHLLETKFQFDSYLSGVTQQEQADLNIKTEGAFIQKQKENTFWIRAKTLKPFISVQAKKDTSLTLHLLNLHPQYSQVTHPSWKPSPTRKTEGSLTLNLKAGKEEWIQVGFQYPNEPYTFLVGGDLEEGFATLLQFKKQLQKENPLFMVFSGDVVDEGDWFRFWLHQDFFRETPFPLFSIMGDGELDPLPEGEKRYFFERTKRFEKFYGNPNFYIPIDEKYGVAGIYNLKFSDRELEQAKAVLPAEVPKHCVLIAHVPLEDARPLEEYEKKAMIGKARAKYLDFLDEYEFPLGFYGELHYFHRNTFGKHEMVVTRGLGGFLFEGDTHDYQRVTLANDQVSYETQLLPLPSYYKFLDKHGYYWWGWWYLVGRKPLWRVAHLVNFFFWSGLFCFFWFKIRKEKSKKQAEQELLES